MSRYDASLQDVPVPMRGTCDGCGSPGGVLNSTNPLSSEHQCPECLKRMALEDRALEHLRTLVENVTALWVQTWGPEFRPYVTAELYRVVQLLDEAPPCPQLNAAD